MKLAKRIHLKRAVNYKKMLITKLPEQIVFIVVSTSVVALRVKQLLESKLLCSQLIENPPRK